MTVPNGPVEAEQRAVRSPLALGHHPCRSLLEAPCSRVRPATEAFTVRGSSGAGSGLPGLLASRLVPGKCG